MDLCAPSLFGSRFRAGIRRNGPQQLAKSEGDPVRYLAVVFCRLRDQARS